MTKQAVDTGRMSEIISEVNEFIHARDFDGLDELIAAYDVISSNKYELIALARSSFSVRIKLPSWGEYIERVRDQLDLRGLDSGRILKGLD